MPKFKIYEIAQWQKAIQADLNNRIIYRLDNESYYTTSGNPKQTRPQTGLLNRTDNPNYFTSAALVFIME